MAGKKLGTIATGPMAKSLVYKGYYHKTAGGLTKAQIVRIKDKHGNIRYRSKKQMKMGKKKGGNQKGRADWQKALKMAKKELEEEGKDMSGFIVPKKGTLLYRRTKDIYKHEFGW